MSMPMDKPLFMIYPRLTTQTAKTMLRLMISTTPLAAIMEQIRQFSALIALFKSLQAAFATPPRFCEAQGAFSILSILAQEPQRELIPKIAEQQFDKRLSLSPAS